MKYRIQVKRRRAAFWVLGCLSLAVLSCNKDEIDLYQGEAGLYFVESQYSSVNDSTSYSFAIQNSEVTSDTVWLPVHIMGSAVMQDRTIELTVVDSLTTAKAGAHYKLLTPYIMPAGAYEEQIGVVLLRNRDLQDSTYKLGLQLTPSKEFPLGLVGQRTYLIKMNDILTKPDNWDVILIYFFGEYSQVKYRFMIDVLGRGDFPTSGAGGLGVADILYYQTAMAAALDKYNAAHPGAPMRDESGNLISFD